MTDKDWIIPLIDQFEGVMNNVIGSVLHSIYCNVDESIRSKVVENESIIVKIVKNVIGKTVRNNLLERNRNE